MVGANATFGVFLVALALGVAALEPSPGAIRAIRIVGGAVLVAIAVSAFRERRRSLDADAAVETRRPFVRGAIAVLVNPGLYLFVATTGAAVIAEGARRGGRGLALLVGLGLLAGVVTTDGLTVFLGAGSRRLPPRALELFLDAAAFALAAFGVALVVSGVRG